MTDVLQTLIELQRFQMFLKELGGVNTSRLQTENPITVFAPSDDAIDFNKSLLISGNPNGVPISANILMEGVFPGRQIDIDNEIGNMIGKFHVSRSTLKPGFIVFGNSTIISKEKATNGLVYVLSDILVP